MWHLSDDPYAGFMTRLPGCADEFGLYRGRCESCDWCCVFESADECYSRSNAEGSRADPHFRMLLHGHGIGICSVCALEESEAQICEEMVSTRMHASRDLACQLTRRIIEDSLKAVGE